MDDWSEFPADQPPPVRRELQGPRPPALKVRKESHSIKKPPIAPPKQPLIIYAVSPKIIHVERRDFSAMVQRLTSDFSKDRDDPSGSISPAARLAAMEKASPSDQRTTRSSSGLMDGLIEDVKTRSFVPGILSPQPSSLPPISPNFFSGLPDPNSSNYLNDLNQILYGSGANIYRNFTEGAFMASPQTRALVSPTPFFDLLNQFWES